MRMQFWKETLDRVFKVGVATWVWLVTDLVSPLCDCALQGSPPEQPVAIALALVSLLADRGGTLWYKVLKKWHRL